MYSLANQLRKRILEDHHLSEHTNMTMLGYAPMYTPTKSMNMDGSDLGQAPEALYYMKNPG